MRAVAAIATITNAIIPSPSETRRPTSGEFMNAAMAESCVEPAIRASVNTIIGLAGAASEAIITSRRLPMPPKLVPTSIPASARKKRALPSRAMMAIRSAGQEKRKRERKGGTNARAAPQSADADQIGGPGEQQARAEGRYQCRRDPGAGEDDVGDDAEEPGRAFRQHDLFAQQPDKVAVRLQERRPLPAEQPCLHLAHKPSEQRA